MDIFRNIAGYVVFFGGLHLVVAVLPPVLALFLAHFFLARKRIKFRLFLPYLVTLFLLLALANIGWNRYISGKIYYEWDTFLRTPVHFFGHERPYFDSGPSWIAFGWTLLKLDYLYFAFLYCLIVVSGVIASFYWPKTFKASDRSIYLKTIWLGTFLLSLFPLLVKIPGLVGGYKHVQGHKVVLSGCTLPIEKNRILYGGTMADYISSGDGRNIEKIWESNFSGASRGVPSPDKSKIAYLDNEGVWIKCTASAGQYLIPLLSKEINERTYSAGELASTLSWSPDSRYIVTNYGGSLLLLDTSLTTKGAKVLAENVAFVNYGYSAIHPRPVGARIFERGTAFYGRDGLIYFTRFEGSKLLGRSVNLMRYSLNDGKEVDLLTSKYPLEVLNMDEKEGWLIIREYDWFDTAMAGEENNETYAYYSSTGVKDELLRGVGKSIYQVDTDVAKEYFFITSDKKYIFKTNVMPYGMVDLKDEIRFYWAIYGSDDSWDVKKAVVNFFLGSKSVRWMRIIGWSEDDRLLIEVHVASSAKEGSGETYVLTIRPGEKPKLIFEPTKELPYLYPSAWL